MPKINKPLEHASHSRVFTIEDSAGPTHPPQYQTLGRAGALTWDQGNMTPIRVADPSKYGDFVTVDTIRGQKGLPSTTIDFRMQRQVSSILNLIKKRCPFDVQLHVGACKDPTDFDAGWETVKVYESAQATSYKTSELGAFDADQENLVVESMDIMALDYYELGPLNFSEVGETTILQRIVDVEICDAKACGACGLPSDGCQKVFAITLSVGASPGLPAKLVYTQDGGATLSSSIVTSLPVNRDPAAMKCVGPYLVIVSQADGSLHYAKITDILAGTATWTKVTTGFNVSGGPNQLYSVSRTVTWIVGQGGFIYTAVDPTAGVTAVSSGDVTSQNLTAIHALDELNVLVGGANNAILLSRNGGNTWALVTGPASKAAVQINAVWMSDTNAWWLAYNDGTLFYTIDGGVTWTQKALPGSLTILNDIQFSKNGVGYIGGSLGSTTQGKILRTINGGYSWYVLPEASGFSIPSTRNFNAIATCTENPNLLWAGGLAGDGTDGILMKGA